MLPAPAVPSGVPSILRRRYEWPVALRLRRHPVKPAQYRGETGPPNRATAANASRIVGSHGLGGAAGSSTAPVPSEGGDLVAYGLAVDRALGRRHPHGDGPGVLPRPEVHFNGVLVARGTE